MARGLPLLLAALGGVGAGLALGWFSFRATTGGLEGERPGEPLGGAAVERRGRSPEAPADGAAAGVSTPAPVATPASAPTDLAPAPAASEATGPALSVATPRPAEVPLYDVDVFRDHLLRAYRNALGRDMAADYLEAALEEGERLYANAPFGIARRWSERETLRERYGEIGEPVDLLLQVRAAGAGETAEVSLVGAGSSPQLLSPSPLDLEDPEGKVAVHVRGGTVPVKSVLAIEEIELFAVLGAKQQEGRFDLRIGSERLALRSPSGRLRGVLRGRTQVSPFGEQATRLQVNRGVGEVRLRGRLVADSDGASFPAAPFRLDGARTEGFLVDSPARLQAVAAPGRRVSLRLDGSSPDRPPAVASDRDVWGRAVPDPRTATGFAFTERAGLVAPGSAFEVQRIVWRVRFEGENGRFDVAAPGLRQPIRVRATDPGPREGEWTGSFVLNPGEEQRVVLAVQNAAVGEAAFYGRVVPR